VYFLIANLTPQNILCRERVFTPEVAGILDFNPVIINPEIYGLVCPAFNYQAIVTGEFELRPQKTAEDAVEKRFGIR
jgi:hypothetical protein